MDTRSDEEILQTWYQYAALQPGFVDSYLQLLRDKQGKSLDEQREEFGVSEVQFNRLRSMRLPREQQFTSDAKRIADACQLSTPLRFVQAMILARNLVRGQDNGSLHGYKAAFDDTMDLDDVPSE